MTTPVAALLRTTALTGVLLVSALAPRLAFAADAPAVASSADGAAGASAGSLEEVVVTAQKRSTNLQKTPIAIAVVSADEISNNHVISLGDLGDGSIPALRVAPMGPRNSALTLGMRGVGSLVDANQPARDQAVGVYLDGVYLGRAQGLGSALYDVDRIEVLKGPQGTLFGRNTEGGAISIVTRAPTGVFDMTTIVGAGNYGSYNAQTHIDLPTVHDVAIKLDALIDTRDGTTRNPTNSGQEDFNAYNKKGVAAEAQWKPTDRFTATYAFDNSVSDTTPMLFQLLKPGTLPLAPLIKVQTDRATTASVGVPLQDSVGNGWGNRLNLDWKVADDVTLKSITSYRVLSQTQFDNGETILSAYAPNAQFSRYSLAHTYQSQYSEELQLIGRAPQLDYVGGLFFYHEAVRDNAQTPNSLQFNATGTAATFLPLDFNTVPYDRASHVTTDSYAAFGQATWTPDFADRIAHLTVGGRLTRDAKKGDLAVVNGALPTYVDVSGNRVTGIIGLDKAWTRFDPMVTLAVDPTSNVDLYAKWSTAYKAGGANSRSLTYRPFDPETVSMYELGAKTEFWDRRVRLNVDAYYGDLKDVQVDFNVVVPNNNRGTTETTNAATGTTKGLDADLTVKVAPGLTASASYTLTEVTLSKAFNPFTNAQSVVYSTFAPKNAASVAVDYERPLPWAVLRAHVDGAYADPQYTSSTDPTLSDRSFIVNGRLALADIRLNGQMSRLELSLWARNLLDEQHVFYRNTNAQLGVYGIFNEPRTFGAQAKIAF